MKKPSELKDLIEELSNEEIVVTLDAGHDASATIYLDEDLETSVSLSREECVILFQTPGTVDQLLEALGSPERASLVLRNIELSLEVLDEAEKRFLAVDED